MRYAQTGIRSYVPPGGACIGHRYEDRPDRDDEHMSVDCERCEPHLAADPLWAGEPAQVPLTDKEQKAAEASKATFDAVAAQAVAGLAAAFAQGGLNVAQLATQAAPGTAPAPAAAAPAAKKAGAAKAGSSRGGKAAAAKTPA
jgi:hypothetical protein